MTLLTKEPTMPTVDILDAPLVVQFDPVIQMDDDQFFDLSDIWEPGF